MLIIFRTWLAVGFISVLMSACGGGGGNPGSVAGTTPTSTVTASVTSLNYQLDKTSITSSVSDKTTLTITVLNSTNNPVVGVTTTVSLDSGIYTPVNSVTDANGLAVGVITTGADRSNRTINATIGVQGKSSPTASAAVKITGTTVTLTPSPSSVVAGSGLKLDVKVADASGIGLPNALIKFGGTLGYTQSFTTDLGGVGTINITSTPSSPGSYSLIGTSMGASATAFIQLTNSDPNAIPSANGVISGASLAAVPSSIPPNQVGSTTNRAQIKALFQTANNIGIQNVRVRFEIISPSLGVNEQISSGSSTVYTDSSGVAQTFYIPDSRSSPTNGVVIRACYGVDDASISNGQCPNSVITQLTVAALPLAVSIGDDNKLTRGNNDLTYIKKFDIAVNDAAGNPVSNAVISASVDITHYGKGYYIYPAYSNVVGVTSTWVPPSINTAVDINKIPTLGTGRVWCPNEDSNRNSVLDLNEDFNGNKKLDPRKSDIVISFLNKNTTDASGRLAIQVEYAQNFATWLSYTVKATTSVSGSEGTDQKSYLTSFIQGDDINGSFLTPTYGVEQCSSPR